jgi:hypothetical protein
LLCQEKKGKKRKEERKERDRAGEGGREEGKNKENMKMSGILNVIHKVLVGIPNFLAKKELFHEGGFSTDGRCCMSHH